MDGQVLAAVLGALGGLLSGAVAAWATLRAKKIDRVLEQAKLWVGSYETKVLEQRLIEYRKLWKLTARSSLRVVDQLTPTAADAFAVELTRWYYEDGGMFLSEASRDRFFDARSALELPLRTASPAKWHATVVDSFSVLRSALTEDVNSRRGPTLRTGQEKDVELDAREAEAEADD